MSSVICQSLKFGNSAMPVLRAIHKLRQSSVVWSWAFNLIRLASALVLLPLLARPDMTRTDLGMYWVFVTLSEIAILFDFGFSPSVARNVSYAMAGAKELTAQGHPETEAGRTPNLPLLWQLLRSTQRLFLYLAGASFVVVGVVGSGIVATRVMETSRPSSTWLAWGLVLSSATLEIYAGWWNTFLRGMNQVLPSAKISVMAYALRLVLAAVLLLAGARLLALPIAGLISSMFQRTLSRRRCLQALGTSPTVRSTRSLMPVLWPNSWRTGVQFLSVYLATKANTLLCSQFLGLAATANYGLTMNVTNLIASMALVWTSVKWPLVGQYCKLQDFGRLREILWPRLWLQTLTFVALAALAAPIGPMLLSAIGSDKQLLPLPFFLALLTYSFLETQFTFWTTLLSLLRNQIPSLWPTVITNMVSLSAVLTLIFLLGKEPVQEGDRQQWVLRGVEIFAFTPLCVGLLFNFWFWPIAGARSIGTRFLRFLFTRPRGEDAHP